MHRRYGPIIRINPDEISINDPDFYEQIYAPQTAVRDKFSPIAGILGTECGSFGTVDHYIHRKRKAANSAFFSKRNISRSETIIREDVAQFCDLLETRTGQVWQLRMILTALKLDIFFDYAFADSLGLLDDLNLAHEWDQTMEAISYCAPYIKMFPWMLKYAMSIPITLCQLLSPQLARILSLRHYIYKHAQIFSSNPARFSLHPKFDQRPQTLFQTLHESALPDEEKSIYRVSQEGSEMFAAAGTTARVMSTAVFHLLNCPSTLKLLQEELDHFIPDRNVIPSVKVLEGLPYMAGVIKESLRMAAPVATRLPLILREPISYREWSIPAGTPISINSRDLLHDPAIFPNPCTFQPERWLDDGNLFQTSLERYFVTFWQGSSFAMYELQITIASLIRRFDLELYDTDWERDVEVVRDCFLSEPRPGTDGVKVQMVHLRA